LTADIPGDGVAVLLRYGAVVVFGAATAAIDNFVASLMPLVTGNIVLREKTIERLQMVADSLAKSVVPSHHETQIAGIFGGI
jgi:uncharacterized Rmd1/YagE family protein